MTQEPDITFPACPAQHAPPGATLEWEKLHVECQRCIIFNATPTTARVVEWFCVGKVLSGVDGAPPNHGGRFAFSNPKEIVVTPEELLFLLGEAAPRGLVPPLAPKALRADPADLLRFFSAGEPRFLQRYLAYRHFRLRKGYVVRAGTGFGVDFMLYKGSPDEVHASYGLWAIDAPSFTAPPRADPRREASPWLPEDPVLDSWNDALLEQQYLRDVDGERRGVKRPRDALDRVDAMRKEAVSWSELQQVCRVMRSVKKNLIVAWPAAPLLRPSDADFGNTGVEVVEPVHFYRGVGTGGWEPDVSAWGRTYSDLCAAEVQCMRFLGVSVTGKHGQEEEAAPEDQAKEGAAPPEVASKGEERAADMAFDENEDML
mmetsp:Transcript_11778/g.35761  ORF Transcript_11778/g.35761 Transcript_11778/m.35761 type:complete len:373 (-) Transcript_11778:69-1187(-)